MSLHFLQLIPQRRRTSVTLRSHWGHMFTSPTRHQYGSGDVQRCAAMHDRRRTMQSGAISRCWHLLLLVIILCFKLQFVFIYHYARPFIASWIRSWCSVTILILVIHQWTVLNSVYGVRLLVIKHMATLQLPLPAVFFLRSLRSAISMPVSLPCLWGHTKDKPLFKWNWSWL